VASEGLHEAADLLDEAAIDRHRAYVSLCEELSAIDWYDQRVHATTDPTLAAVLAHNRDDEKEHAAMALEWLRRRDSALDEQLRLYLFTTAPIAMDGIADAVEAAEDDGDGAAGDGSLGIGSLRGSE
jgi:ferritin-like protein